jgi:hypothetical protein
MDYGMIYNPETNAYLIEKPTQPIQRDLNKILA